MSKTFEQGKEAVVKLCEHFATNRETFCGPGIKEAHVRQMLIDPLFEALGWDVRNEARAAPQYREVVPEDSLDVEGQQKAPDYTFRVGMLPKFYVEAKRCSVNIGADPAPAYQLRRYGWSAKLALSILTDFEELAVYDCTIRPRQTDKASRARVLHLGYQEYADRWRDLWDLFSREAVWSGKFDQYAASKRKRGTSEVDAEFLKEIEIWRIELAKNIALRNEGLSSDDLNAAVQATINRVVFLRMAEDRRLEPEEQLLGLCDRDDVYARFMRTLCRKADEKYNSGLFHFEKEPDTDEEPDRITPKLAVDDKVFRPILQSLYFAHGSPYQFHLLPVEILGTVYERFLGKVIRLTAGHQAKVEEKPEVRKAGGVYYTPKYIVDYIVEHTVGRQIKGRSPAQLVGLRNGKQPLRVLDMACGSGSFLLGAYQCLLEHYLGWYVEHDPKKHKKAVYQDARGGEWRLTIGEKKRILTTHIFGVDLDAQAVEVTKLSLLLKVLEGETDQSVSDQQRLFHDRALPNLAENVKCGNSLIGPDYFTGRLIDDLDEMRRIKPFDWEDGFPEAMNAGGFNCIIGNPPYVRIQTMKEWAPREVEIYKELFRAGRTGNYDIYVVFIEQGLRLLSAKGRLGFICPHKFFNSRYGEPARQMIAEGKHLSHVVHFGDQQVFENATTYTCLLLLDKSPAEGCRFVQVKDLAQWKSPKNGDNATIAEEPFAESTIPASHVAAEEWNFHAGNGAGLHQKLSQMSVTLGDVADIFVGLQTSADDVYIMDLVQETAKTYRLMSKSLGRPWTFEKNLLFPLLSGTDVRAYAPLPNRQYILFPYAITKDRASLIALDAISRKWPKTAAYLSENKKRLERREKGRMRGPAWHGYVYRKNMARQPHIKLCVPRLVEHLHAAYDHDGSHFLDNVDVGGVVLKPAYADLGLEFLLAILNCRLMRWYFPRVSAPFRGGWRSANKQFLSLIPIRVIDFKRKRDSAAHGRMVKLVDSMLSLHKHLPAAKSASQKTLIQRQINATDREIDRLVYELYGLSKAEIAIVEEATQ